MCVNCVFCIVKVAETATSWSLFQGSHDGWAYVCLIVCDLESSKVRWFGARLGRRAT